MNVFSKSEISSDFTDIDSDFTMTNHNTKRSTLILSHPVLHNMHFSVEEDKEYDNDTDVTPNFTTLTNQNTSVIGKSNNNTLRSATEPFSIESFRSVSNRSNDINDSVNNMVSSDESASEY